MAISRPSLQKVLTLLASIALLASLVNTAGAQPYPAKPIRLIIDFPAGGVSDILARAVGDGMTAELGQPLVYENKPGAGGRLPYAMMARAETDGYTVGFISTPFVLLPNLVKKLNYDAEKDFLPVGLIARYPNVVLVNSQLPATSLQQFIDYVKAKGSKFNYGSFGVGSSQHLTMELFRALANLPGTHVPYAGSPQGMQALLAGDVDVIFANIPGGITQIRGGRLKPLAVTGRVRSSVLPDVPTMNELGLTFDTVGFSGIVVPAGTPEAVVRRLNQAIAKAVTNQDVMKRVRSVGAEPAEPMTPAEFAKFLDQEMKTWAPVIKRAGGPFQD